MVSHGLDLPDLYSRALVLNRDGKAREAAQLCRRILAADADHFDAWQLLGLIHAGQGDLVEAARSLGHAVKLKPRDPQALSNLGNILFGMRQFNEAVLFFETALSIDQNAPVIWYNRGLVLWEMRRLEESLASFDRALGLNADNPQAQLARVAPLRDMGRFEDALQGCDAALALAPEWVDALNLRGSLLWRLKRFDAALDSFNRAQSLAPRSAEIANNRGLALSGMERLEDALLAFDQAVMLEPSHAEAWSNRGSVLTSLQRFEEAVQNFDKAIALKPGYGEALNNRGAALVAMGRSEEGLASYAAAVKASPGNAAAPYNQVNTLVRLGRFAEALTVCDSMRAAFPRHPYALSAAANAALTLCDWPRVAALKDEIARAVADQSAVIAPFTLLGYCDDPALQRRATESWLADKQAACAGPWAGPLPPPSQKLKIAYLSADFTDHPVGHRMLALLAHHDRAGFELHGLSIGSDGSSSTTGETRRKLAASFDHFHDVHLMSDRQVAELMRRLGIDVAVDLTGHTQDGRPGIFAARAAPVQAAYLGYPGTTGSACMDYILADAVVAPFHRQEFYSEAIVHLPGSFFPAGPDRALPAAPSRKDAGLPQTGIVFCCFHQSWKVTEAIFDVWMRLLAATEGSVLWLADGPKEPRAKLEHAARARGIDLDRLIWAPEAGFEGHLARLQLADLMLDSFPYNAHASAADALLAGVPVVTCRGESFAARVAASLLTAAGLDALVTKSLADYEALALTLARDPAARAGAKQTLAAHRAALFDLDAKARALEAAFRHMRARADGKSASGFTVTTEGTVL